MALEHDLPEHPSWEDERRVLVEALEPMLAGGVKAAEVAGFVCDVLAAPAADDVAGRDLHDRICFYAREAVLCASTAHVAMGRLREARNGAEAASAVVEVSIQASNAGLSLSRVVEMAVPRP